jgi:hypothetical protein
MPRRLARAEMVANAGYVGLTVTPTAEVERILARAANAATTTALADPAEIGIRGELP